MKRKWLTDELIEYFTITPAEFLLLEKKRLANKIGFVVLFKFFQMESRFPSTKIEVPSDIVDFLAEQVHLQSDLFSNYTWKGRSFDYHKSQIREYFGFREPTSEDADEVISWLHKNRHCYDREKVRDEAYQRFREMKIEPPTSERVERVLSSAISIYEEQFFCHTYRELSENSIFIIDQLLIEINTSSKKNTITFNDLRADPGRIGLDSILKEIRKLRKIKEIKISDNIFQHVPTGQIKKYKQRVGSELLSEIKRHPKETCYPLLAVFFWIRSREITDNLVELLIQLVHKINSKAERTIDKELINDFRKVSGKYNILKIMAEESLGNPDGIIREVIFPVVNENILKDLVKEFRLNSSAYIGRVYKVMRNSYSRHYRRMVPEILNILEFRSNNETHKPVIKALKVLKQHINSRKQYFPISDEIPIDDIVKSKWKESIIETDEKGNQRINRINYEICVLKELRDKLRCKEIWVLGANRYRNPEEDLPVDFDDKRKMYYEYLNQPENVDEFIEKLKKDMEQALEKLNNKIPTNNKVKLSTRKGGRIKISRTLAHDESLNLTTLKAELMRQWPMINLLDILKETDLQINFTNHFKSMGIRETLKKDTIRKRLILTLFALGTNTGLKRLARASNEKESFDDLRYIKRKFINKDNLRNAIIAVINGIINKRIESIWGIGTTSCASDSKKFGSWDQNLLTEWHIRYHGRGIMIYWHVEKKSACIYSQLKSCSSSEVASMIEGVLHHCTEMEIDRNYVDTHGQSEVAFAFSYLLNFHLMPRLKNIRKQKLYLPDVKMKENYSNLSPILTRNINWKLIKQEYDQMIKYTTALRFGTAETDAIMKRFTKNNIKHPTYQALQELGKVIKTIFLCGYIDSEALRIEINDGLNVIENWNSVNSFVFYGKSGEISTNNLGDQELSVLSLQLLQNCMIYINTLMIQEILSKEKWINRMTTEDLRALTPLIYQHINPYGNFELNMNERMPLKIGA